MCEHVEAIGKQESPARVQAPSQKRRAVIRVESVETQDDVLEPQGLEESDDEEMEELSFMPSAVSVPLGLAQVRQRCIKKSFKFLPTCGRCGGRRRSSAHIQFVQDMLSWNEDEAK